MPKPVSLSDLQKMHRMAAALMIKDPIYQPLFERVEYEISVFEGQGDAVSRARALLQSQRAVA